jgi:hypothetical protein
MVKPPTGPNFAALQREAIIAASADWTPAQRDAWNAAEIARWHADRAAGAATLDRMERERVARLGDSETAGEVARLKGEVARLTDRIEGGAVHVHDEEE